MRFRHNYLLIDIAPLTARPREKREVVRVDPGDADMSFALCPVHGSFGLGDRRRL